MTVAVVAVAGAAAEGFYAVGTDDVVACALDAARRSYHLLRWFAPLQEVRLYRWRNQLHWPSRANQAHGRSCVLFLTFLKKLFAH